MSPFRPPNNKHPQDKRLLDDLITALRGHPILGTPANIRTASGGQLGASEPDTVSDIEVGRHALRTFKVGEGKLGSVWKPHAWDPTGVEIARCFASGRACPSSPNDDCNCGIYGTVTLDALMDQYQAHTRHTVAVIAAEGTTIIGSKGLRTEAARIVAYWCRYDHVARGAYAQCEGARRFDTVTEMLAAYDFPPSHYSVGLDRLGRRTVPGSEIPGVALPQAISLQRQHAALDQTLDQLTAQILPTATQGGIEALRHALGHMYDSS